MKTYPMMMNINEKAVVVVGGGRIAYRKIVGLLQAGANVTVISPHINEQALQLVQNNQIKWKDKQFESADIEPFLLVIAATNHKTVNEFVATSVKAHQLINVVDDPGLCDFHVPATLTRGNLTLTVSTGGASPILAKKICDELSIVYDESYPLYLEFLAEARERIKDSVLSTEAKLLLLKEITKDMYRETNEKQSEFLKMIRIFEKDANK